MSLRFSNGNSLTIEPFAESKLVSGFGVDFVGSGLEIIAVFGLRVMNLSIAQRICSGKCCGGHNVSNFPRFQREPRM